MTAQNSIWDPPGGTNWVKFYTDSGFTKGVTDEKGTLELLGYASTWIRDRDDEIVVPTAFDDTLSPYLEKNPIMLWQHDMEKPMGVVRNGAVDDGGLKIAGHQPKPEDQEPDWKHLAYHSVKKGIVRTFSIGGYFERDMLGKQVVISRVHLMEVSVVSIPANPESIFEAATKAIGHGTTRPDLTQRHIGQAMQLLGMREITDPELVVMNEKQRIARYDELVGFYKLCGRMLPEYEAFHELAKETLSSKGLAAVGAGKKVITLMRQVQGYASDPPADTDEKRGRAISAKNEQMLKSALDHLGAASEAINETLASYNDAMDPEEEMVA